MNEPWILFIASAYLVLVLTTLVHVFWKTLPNLGNSILTLISLAVSISSLYVAIATYQKAIKDSEEQQKNLDASRKQLQAVVDAAITQQGILNRNLETSQAQQELLNQNLQTSKIQQKIQSKNLETSKAQLTLLQEQSKREVETAITQQGILNRNFETSQAQQELLNRSLQASKIQQEIQSKNLETSKAQLTLLEEQNKREQERQARKPTAEVALQTNSGAQSLSELEKLPEINFPLEKDQKWQRAVFIVRNTGKTEIARPIIRIIASDKNIHVDEADFRIAARVDPFAFQFSGEGITDIDPVEFAEGGYKFIVDITVPDSVIKFDLIFLIQGKNLPRKSHTLHFKVTRPSS